jgi:hypothetical protein
MGEHVVILNYGRPITLTQTQQLEAKGYTVDKVEDRAMYLAPESCLDDILTDMTSLDDLDMDRVIVNLPSLGILAGAIGAVLGRRFPTLRLLRLRKRRGDPTSPSFRETLDFSEIVEV